MIFMLEKISIDELQIENVYHHRACTQCQISVHEAYIMLVLQLTGWKSYELAYSMMGSSNSIWPIDGNDPQRPNSPALQALQELSGWTYALNFNNDPRLFIEDSLWNDW